MLLQTQPVKAKQTDESRIRYLLKEIVNAFNANDVETLLSLHSDDVILMDPGMPLIQGKKNIREMFAGFQKRELQIQLAYDIHELETYDRLAFVRGTVYKTSSLLNNKSQRDTY